MLSIALYRFHPSCAGFDLRMSARAKILDCRFDTYLQDGQVVLSVMENDEDEQTTRCFQIVGNYTELPRGPVTYIGTFGTPGGFLQYLFELLKDQA